ncbi:MAG: outer membrane protein assembly factor BamE (lipoprotein component of BamABCDE complex) [Flavobacteriales bacterium]|jgi:outer membrane protein assembly factor BamE (lipoprotein component of BamABCDE complex)
MNKTVVKRIGMGVGLYAVFVMAVILLYPDTPQDMDWQDREAYNNVQISKLELGLQKKQILELLGSPDITEAKRINNNELQVMFYRTQHKKSDGITTEDECTALLFENNELIAWGDNAYQSFVDG